MKSAELKRWLADQGATFKPVKGGHLKVELNGRFTVLPMHSKDLKDGACCGHQEKTGLEVGRTQC
jgi:predicted RNA binding protein YcfA (HicA-like mRNA interferase family)